MISVRLFGMIKSLADNQESLALELTGARRVRDLVGLVEARYPQIGELIHKKKVLVSVNHEIAHEDLEIREGDEVALLPPFAGGTAMGQMSEESMLVRVQRENFSIDAEIDRVRSRSKRCGPAAPARPRLVAHRRNLGIPGNRSGPLEGSGCRKPHLRAL